MRTLIQFLIPLLIVLALVVIVARRPSANKQPGNARLASTNNNDALPLPMLVFVILIGASLSVALVYGLMD